MEATDKSYSAALDYARDLGAQHGKSAASWVEIPDERTARLILAGMEDGDPAILDTLPSPDLSGQWADSLTGPQLVRDAWEAAGEDVDDIYRLAGRRDVDDGFSDICEAYEDAFSLAAQDEVDRLARAAIPDEHYHAWGAVETARMTGNPHRKCECGAVTLDLSDED